MFCFKDLKKLQIFDSRPPDEDKIKLVKYSKPCHYTKIYFYTNLLSVKFYDFQTGEVKNLIQFINFDYHP